MSLLRPLARRGAGVVLAAVVAAPSLIAQPSAQPRSDSTHPVPSTAQPSRNDARPSAIAAPRHGDVAVDGRIDEAAWQAATPITQLTQQQPDAGRPASERTEIRILYDAAALYVGARMYDSQGGKGVRALLVRRDQLMNGNNASASDKIALVLDPYHDRNTRVWFELNPLGVKGDHFNGDGSYDPVWEGASHVDSLGWTAEFRIPLSQLRFSRDSVQTWGFQVWRTLSRRNEQDMWAYWRPNESGGPAYFGTLGGLALTRPPRQVEFVPYVVTSDKFSPVAAGDPFHRTGQTQARVGADVKLNLTSNLTLDATINPDFGQVEVDPAVVNLSAFETFYQEKRPFFVANSSAFSYGNFSCFFCSNVSNLGVFYSRRIGRAPQLAGVVGAKSDYMDAPDATTILGAAKITGRTRNGWTVGMLDAITDRAQARYIPAGGIGRATQEVEPLANYFMGRLRRDLNKGNTRIGGITTLTNRRLTDVTQRERLRGDAEVVGLDVVHYWKERSYSLTAQAAGSRIGGDTAAIRRTQQTSAHYFQRPDRQVTSDGLFGAGYDPARTSLSGYGVYARLAKESGDWLWETAQNWRSPGFEVNDMSFMSRADYKWMNANVLRQWTTPTRWYRDAAAILGGQQQFNYDGDRTDAQEQLWGRVTLRNYLQLSSYVVHRPSVLDDRMTRGGPVVRRAGLNATSLNVSTDGRRAVVFDVGGEAARLTGAGGSEVNVSTGVTYKPSTRILLSLSPNYSRGLSTQQYVTTVDDPTATAFAGRRYVFAAIDQRTLSLDTRINTTFTPTMTLELFAQPYIASGRYSRFGEFAAPRTIAMREYGADMGSIAAKRDASGLVSEYTLDPDGASGPAKAYAVANPDFNFRSLRGTAVMRWEYRPGSTLFFVWTQQRSGSAAWGDLDLARDRSALFRDRPTNIFQIKATYWLGR